MPNQNRPAGLQPLRAMGGGIPMRANSYAIASALAQNLFRGDPVVMTGTGRNITIATAGNTNSIVGAFAGVRYRAADGSLVWSPTWTTGTVTLGSEDAEAFVYDDPDMLFSVQVSTATGLVAADIGSGINIVSGTGSSLTGISGFQADQTSLSNSAQRQLQIQGLSPLPDNDYGQYAKAMVRINNHQLRLGVGF